MSEQEASLVPKDYYVVRLYAFGTERKIADISAVQYLVREYPETEKRPEITHEISREERPILQDLDFANMSSQLVENTFKLKHEGIHDERVEPLEISLGYKMLQMVGIVGDAPFAQKEKYENFDKYLEIATSSFELYAYLSDCEIE